MSDLRFAAYMAQGGQEQMVRHGPIGSPIVLLLLPLFHEHDRLRAFGGAVMRVLAETGIASACPDLPGQNESERPLPDRLLTWTDAAATAAFESSAVAALSIRSGALFDGAFPAQRRYRFVPATGGALVRDLRRAAAIADREAARESTDLVRLGGREVPSTLLTDLAAAAPEPAAGRTARLDGDDRPADVRLVGPMLWRRAEPGNDLALARALAEDCADWIRSCVAS